MSRLTAGMTLSGRLLPCMLSTTRLAPRQAHLAVTLPLHRQQSTLSQLLSNYRTLQAPYTPQEENRAEWDARRKELRKKLGLYRLLGDTELEEMVEALRAGQDGLQQIFESDGDFEHNPGAGYWNVTRIKGSQSNLDANLQAARAGSKPTYEAEAHALLKQYQFKDWVTGMDFLNQATEVIEDQDHHPSIHMKLDPTERKLVLSVMTHTHTPRRPASSAAKASSLPAVSSSGAGEARHASADKEMPAPAPGITKKDILLAWELDRLADDIQ